MEMSRVEALLDASKLVRHSRLTRGLTGRISEVQRLPEQNSEVRLGRIAFLSGGLVRHRREPVTSFEGVDPWIRFLAVCYIFLCQVALEKDFRHRSLFGTVSAPFFNLFSDLVCPFSLAFVARSPLGEGPTGIGTMPSSRARHGPGSRWRRAGESGGGRKVVSGAEWQDGRRHGDRHDRAVPEGIRAPERRDGKLIFGSGGRELTL